MGTGKNGTYRWSLVTAKAPFAPRDGAGALSFAGRMWLIGGWNPKDKGSFPRVCSNDVWSSRDGAAWTLEKPNTFVDATFDGTRDWEGRHTAGYVVHRGQMWIVGGDPIQGHYQPDVWSSGDGRSWQAVARGSAVPWGIRALHYTVSFRDRIWIIGGQTVPPFAPSEELFFDDVWSSGDGARWERVEQSGSRWPQRGMIGGSAVFRDRIWILGGGRYDTPKIPTRVFFNDVWSSEDGSHWQCHTPAAPWHPRQYHDVAVFDDKLWVLEGWNQKNRNDVWYSADGTSWHEVPGTPWAPRHAASVFVHDDALWMVAGNNMESDVWKLTREHAAR
jgi:hypothetical protein